MRQPFTLLTPMLKIILPLLILCSVLLVGCGSSAPALKPFKMDIQQGNVVTSKMLLQLKPGMTKSQVRFIMGTPLIVDSFHKDRWDYFYQMRQAGKIIEQRRVILDFEKELLTKVRGDVVPQGTLGAANSGADAGEANGLSAPITVEPKPKEVSMLDKLKFWKKDEKAIAKPEVKPELVAPAEVAVVPAVAAVVALPEVVAAAAAESKNEVAKPEMVIPEAAASSAVKKSVSEKSLLDKLKFWKKDAPVAVTEKVAPAAASATTDIPNAPASEAASVLAVPIELPNDDTTTTAMPKEDAVIAAPLKTEPLKTQAIAREPSAPAKKVAAPSASISKPPPEKPAPVDSQFSRPLKSLPLSAKKGEPLIFRMDKTLDLARGLAVKPDAMPMPAAPDVTTKPIKVEAEPLPVESEPSFFDKMLEKIGF